MKIEGQLNAIDREKHFSDYTTSRQDKLAGDSLANEIGDTYIDYANQSPVEQWTQVIKALRIHGFDISFPNT